MPGKIRNSVQRAAGYLRALLQPQPLYPLSYGIITFFLAQFYNNVNFPSGVEPNIQTWMSSAPTSILYAIALGAPLFALQQLLGKIKAKLAKKLAYHLGIFATAALFASLLAFEYGRATSSISFGVFRIYLVIAVVSVLAGAAQRKLIAQVDRAEAALAEADRQRALVLSADEATRRQVASFLHDRVQAGLVVTALQLKLTSEKIAGPAKAELVSLIEELEIIRKFDLRDAGQQLSPDFRLIGLDEALRGIIRAYEKTMIVKTTFSGEVSALMPEMNLGIYRICEQALLNAAAHGHATACEISLTRRGHRKVILSVTNNGSALPQTVKTGSGSAIIDAWVQKFDGHWSLDSKPNLPVTLSVLLQTP